MLHIMINTVTFPVVIDSVLPCDPSYLMTLLDAVHLIYPMEQQRLQPQGFAQG